MQIKELVIHNIMSIDDAIIEFGDSGLVLVDGWNFDANRANGAGKTAIFNALSFALYGEVPRKITITQVLRRGTKEGFAIASVQTKDGLYTVKRSRPSAVKYELNGQDIDITQEEFEEKIGLNYEQFQICMYSAQGGLYRPKKFLEQNDRDKKEFILSLMNLNFFRNCEKEANTRAKRIEAEINQKKIELQGYIAKIQAYSESLVDKDEVDNSIKLLQEEIQGFQEEIKNSTVDRPDLSKFDALEAKIQEKRDKYNQLRYELSLTRNEYEQKKRLDVPYVERKPDAQCPKCSADLSITGTNVALHEDESERIKQHEVFREQLRTDMSGLAREINGLEDKLSSEREINQLESQVKQKKRDTLQSYEDYQKHRGELERAISQREMKITQLQEMLAKSDQIAQNIDTLKSSARKTKDEIEALGNETEILKAASQVFSPTGAPAYIMDSVVDSFNDAVSRCIQLIWPGASYHIQTFKESKKDKTKKAQFSEHLNIHGKDVSPGSLSGGEARAFSLAVDFAIIEILSQNFSIKMNPIVLDEPFDGLDSVGRETVVDLLEQLSDNYQIWVVDHASESKSLFSDVVRVEKHGGVSKVIT